MAVAFGSGLVIFPVNGPLCTYAGKFLFKLSDGGRNKYNPARCSPDAGDPQRRVHRTRKWIVAKHPRRTPGMRSRLDLVFRRGCV